MEKPITVKSMAAAIAAVAVLAGAGVAEACSCLRFQSAAEQMQKADLVFEGRVIRTERIGRDRAATTFEVLDRLKGPMSRRLRVEHGTETGAGCGVAFKRGEIVGVTAHRTRGGWATSSCEKPQFDWREFRRAAGRGR